MEGQHVGVLNEMQTSMRLSSIRGGQAQFKYLAGHQKLAECGTSQKFCIAYFSTTTQSIYHGMAFCARGGVPSGCHMPSPRLMSVQLSEGVLFICTGQEGCAC